MFLFLPAVIVTFHWVLSGSQLPSAHPTAADYRGLADEYVRAEKFDKASEAFARASELYAKLGDLNASVILLGQSKRYRTDVDLYVEQPGGNDSAKQNFTAAKFEPMLGCFTGVNIEREDITRDPVKFDAIVRKPQAMFFMYRSYGMPFPTEFAKRLKSVHAGLQIAYEPRSIGAVVDGCLLARLCLRRL